MEFFLMVEYLILSGLVLGVVMGVLVRCVWFCIFGVVEDYILIGKMDCLWVWVLVIVVVIFGV